MKSILQLQSVKSYVTRAFTPLHNRHRETDVDKLEKTVLLPLDPYEVARIQSHFEKQNIDSGRTILFDLLIRPLMGPFRDIFMKSVHRIIIES